MSKLPKVTQESVLYVDATPDRDYPIRILEAYRENCNCKWVVSGFNEGLTDLYNEMNKACDKRAEILDRAIAVLREDNSTREES